MPAKEKNVALKPLGEAITQGRLQDKICLITGGAGNIGETITARFLSEGAICIITGRNQEKLRAIAPKALCC
ncbi:MAG: NAD(P)-binding domain-containing protein [Chloroherpetonaceae bacterium]|nr:NAD(P)-binding domain-containing protein [Chloroherpetonaceae bacterium]